MSIIQFITENVSSQNATLIFFLLYGKMANQLLKSIRFSVSNHCIHSPFLNHNLLLYYRILIYEHMF
ncbi:hypothetical protein HanIR_Chr14g0704441 [Helianthus annuus]|nr:hypothetical protein HanIR_Chr14g0704441 [Helianthus annuus]